MAEPVGLSLDGGIAVLELNAPQTKNALSRAMLEKLDALLPQLSEDPACHAIVLTGAGGHFCAGGDLSGMKAERTLAYGRSRISLGHSVLRHLVGSGKPVIVAVEGYAAGAGLSLVAAADFSVAGQGAKFVASFGKVGLVPDMGLLWTLPQRTGLAYAKRLFFSGEVIDSDKALAHGLLDQVVETGGALAAAKALAASFAATAPLPKAAFRRGVQSLDDALAFEIDNQAALYLTRDHREAVSAFFDKRTPIFTGD